MVMNTLIAVWAAFQNKYGKNFTRKATKSYRRQWRTQNELKPHIIAWGCSHQCMDPETTTSLCFLYLWRKATSNYVKPLLQRKKMHVKKLCLQCCQKKKFWKWMPKMELKLNQILKYIKNALEILKFSSTADQRLGNHLQSSKIGLLRAVRYLRGKPARVLFDTESQMSYASKWYGDKQKINYTTSVFTVEMDYKESQHSLKTNHTLNVYLQSYAVNILFAACSANHGVVP